MLFCSSDRSVQSKQLLRDAQLPPARVAGSSPSLFGDIKANSLTNLRRNRRNVERGGSHVKTLAIERRSNAPAAPVHPAIQPQRPSMLNNARSSLKKTSTRGHKRNWLSASPLTLPTTRNDEESAAPAEGDSDGGETNSELRGGTACQVIEEVKRWDLGQSVLLTFTSQASNPKGKFGAEYERIQRVNISSVRLLLAVAIIYKTFFSIFHPASNGYQFNQGAQPD